MKTPRSAVYAFVGAIFIAGSTVGMPASAAPVSARSAAADVSSAGTTTLAGVRLGTLAAAPAVSAATMLTSLVTTLTPAQAVAQARSEAAANGITDYVSVTDMATGTVLAQTSNAGTQVASESIVKLMIAAYYMVIAGGYQKQSSTVRDQLSYMIRYSDDATASAYFTSAAVPTIAARYGMSSTINATDRVGHWGAVRITAHDMTTFLFRAMRDPAVGPWLKPVMAQVAPNGSDGFNQHFGMNALTGTHGSKQGWGDDQFWSAANNVINSVGYTDRYYVAVLQNSYSYPDPARATSTYAARTIQAARPAAPKPPAVSPPRNGDYVREAGSAAVYRLAGGAPLYVSSWTAVGGKKPVKVLTVAQWKTLRAVPVDGTFLSGAVGGAVYRVAGGAPIYISSWAQFGSRQATTAVDAAVFSHAGLAGAWSHLRARPADGTFISASKTGAVYRIAGGAPIYVSSWNEFGFRAPTVAVAADVFSHAGLRGPWDHLANLPADGTFITSTTDHRTYRIAGGAPLFITSWVPLGGVHPSVLVDRAALTHTGLPGVWVHLKTYPANGTFITGEPSRRTYRVYSGHATFVPSWAPYGGPKPAVTITQTTIDKAGTTWYYAHLRR